MRIMSWNVNGIKTLLQYSPWNALKTYENVLNELGADVICFQETKITKKQVTRDMAVLPSFDSFFSSYSRKPEKGYSGTCIFTRRSKTIPLKAEEGISGLLPLERKPEPSEEDLIGGTLGPNSIALNMQDVKTIDLEGRTTIVDLGLFVLIDVYCPNETNEERLDFKLAFNAMLEARILNLIRLGREVIVLGDLNICRNPIDHCDPIRRMKDSSYANFGDHPARKWLNDFVAPGTGVMVDLGRHFYPDRKSMFTHWETRINARETNYGTRIDYILATPGLLPWIKTCEIQPNILGSDHCPVIADFYESITTEDGRTEYLWDKVNPPGRSKESYAAPPDPPKLAAKFYSEFGAEQRLLSNFFKKPPASTQADSASVSRISSNTPSHTPSHTPQRDWGNDLQTGTASVDVSAGGSAPPVMPPPSTLMDDTSAATLRKPSVGSPAGSSVQHRDDPRREVNGSWTQLPVASSSIDLTLDISDEGETLLAAKKPIKSTKKSNKKSKASSSLSSPAPSNDSSRLVTKPRGRKGQQTLATFFKPPTPTPEVAPTPPKESSKLSRGKDRVTHKAVHAEAGAVNVPATSESGDLIVSSGDERLGDSAVGKSELNSLKRRASIGAPAPNVNEDAPPNQKRHKSRDISADVSSDSDIQDIVQGSSSNPNEQASSAWSSIFSPKVAPLCSMHGEPCKQWAVNKPGKNKGRVFWLCARPVGEGYDKGQSKAEVNPEYRCNYFKWESDVKRTNSIPTSNSSKKRR